MRKKIIFVFIIVIVLATACKKDDETNSYQMDETKPYQMTVTTQQSDVSIGMRGYGKISIDWGDKTEIESFSLQNNNINIPHSYPDSVPYTITVTGYITAFNCTYQSVLKLDLRKNPALTELHAGYNKLTSLDVSHNTGMELLDCYLNQLTDLDVSKNTELEYLNCHTNRITKINLSNNTKLYYFLISSNSLTVGALHEMFGTLHNYIDMKGRTKRILISGNLGAIECDRSIAEYKGWVFE